MWQCNLPNDIIAIDDLKIITGYEIEPVEVNEKRVECSNRTIDNMSTHIEAVAGSEEEPQQQLEQEQTESSYPMRKSVRRFNLPTKY